MSKAFDIAHNVWYRRAKKRAMMDPTYAAEERGRSRNGSFIASGEGYTLDGFWAHEQHFDEINPKPFWYKIHWWLEAHGLRAQWRNLKIYHQRGRRGYADYDLWSLDGYLCDMLPAALLQLRDRTHGYPDGPNGFESFEDWQAALTEMAEGFKAGRRYIACEDTYQADEQKFRDGIELFSANFFSLWD